MRDIENLGGEARFIAADVSDADDVRRLATEAGDVDILIDDAGIHGASKGAPRTHEIANAVTFLAAASYVNGAALTIGGG